jgi:hypothetical protein
MQGAAMQHPTEIWQAIAGIAPLPVIAEATSQSREQPRPAGATQPLSSAPAASALGVGSGHGSGTTFAGDLARLLLLLLAAHTILTLLEAQRRPRLLTYLPLVPPA